MSFICRPQYTDFEIQLTHPLKVVLRDQKLQHWDGENHAREQSSKTKRWLEIMIEPISNNLYLGENFSQPK